MTERLYYLDPYLQEFDAIVTVFSEGSVELDRTAFYPGGGGQPSDQGQLLREGESFTVTKVKAREGSIWHSIDHEKLRQGEAVLGKVDWQHRYKLMRTHTAMHILCGVIWRDYGASVTGGNMTPGRGRMDFEFETMQKELVEEIEEKINIEVEAARPVTADVLPREEAFQIPDLIRTKINLLPEGIQEVRIVEIDGLDLQADGGTHVANTSEVGQIRIVDYKSKGRINKRLVVELED